VIYPAPGRISHSAAIRSEVVADSDVLLTWRSFRDEIRAVGYLGNTKKSADLYRSG
jgi:hypothetical protein